MQPMMLRSVVRPDEDFTEDFTEDVSIQNFESDFQEPQHIQETNDVPELEDSPPPVVGNIHPLGNIQSSILRTKEAPHISQRQQNRSGGVVILDDGAGVQEQENADQYMVDYTTVPNTVENEVLDYETNTYGDGSLTIDESTEMNDGEYTNNFEKMGQQNLSEENTLVFQEQSQFQDSGINNGQPDSEMVFDSEPTKEAGQLESKTVVRENIQAVQSMGKKMNLQLAKAIPSQMKTEENERKRKLNTNGEYDPSSPTSENNDESQMKKMALLSNTASKNIKLEEPVKTELPELDKYWKTVNDDPSDFTAWTYLLQYVDQEGDVEAAREAYNKFLKRYPYCYGYWRKFADFEKKKGDSSRIQKVFDRGLSAISLSVDLWLHYIAYCKTIYEDDEAKMREQYERAIEACGLEFRSDRLWENYIKWEMDAKRLHRVTMIYDRLLATPTMGYLSHFETFQEFVAMSSPNRILSVDDFLAHRVEVKSQLKSDDAFNANDAPPGEDMVSDVPASDEETRLIREKIIAIRQKIHKANVAAVTSRWPFEEGIKRPYFHVKPLERCQLKNWKDYLDYEIEQKNHKRIVILFERCLVACALYDEFWLKFIRYLESQMDDNTTKIREVYTRACTIHHQKKPNLHLLWATFEEKEGDFDKASRILEEFDAILPNMLQVAYRRINLQRRRGKLDEACALYESYIGQSKNQTIANHVAVKYARFLCKIRNNIDEAMKVMLEALEKDKDNPRLHLQLIDLSLQRNPVDYMEVIGFMDLFIDREEADIEQRVLFAQRKVEFVEDFSPDVQIIIKAHEQFQNCIKQAKERRKAMFEEAKLQMLASPKKTKPAEQPSPTSSVVTSQPFPYTTTTTAPYQPDQYQNSQYAGQTSYPPNYQQYPPPTDPNYANYQNWQYGQTGAQQFAGPFNQWGSYNYY